MIDINTRMKTVIIKPEKPEYIWVRYKGEMVVGQKGNKNFLTRFTYAPDKNHTLFIPELNVWIS